jgi:hypothetical protein
MRDRVCCPKCLNKAWKPYAEEYGELQGTDSWYPYFKWRVMGTCKKHGLVEIEDHDAEDACLCSLIHDWDVWWSEDDDLQPKHSSMLIG